MTNLQLKSLIELTAYGCRYFASEASEYYITQIYNEPKLMLSDDGSVSEYVVIGLTYQEEIVCVGIGKANSGNIFLWGWVGFHEYFTVDENGEEDEYQQDDIYGYYQIANSLNEFCDMLYRNGTLFDSNCSLELNNGLFVLVEF